MKYVLLASSSIDQAHIRPVARYIERAGLTPVLYESDMVFDGKKRLSISINNGPRGGLTANYDGVPLHSGTVGAAWYRRPGTPLSSLSDNAKRMRIESEIRSLQEGLWTLVPDGRWLNAPLRIKAAENKLAQLALAKKVGFNVPRTVVANNWERIREDLPSPLIMKMTKGLLHDGDKDKLLSTTILDERQLDRLRDTKPFPGIFQEYLQKGREWRISVVGKEVFSAAIYTDKDAKDDWRKWQFTKSVQFRAEAAAPDIQEKCIQFLDEIGLYFGAFDFVESPDGKVTFLELNPNGQYAWLERTLGLPISAAIGSHLVKTAKQ